MSRFEMDHKTNISQQSNDKPSNENILVLKMVSVEGAHTKHIEDQIENHEILGSIS